MELERTDMDFRIRRAGLSDVGEIMKVMDSAVTNTANQDWFVSDDADFITEQLASESFILAAETPGGEMAAFLLVRVPGTGEVNLGPYLNLKTEEELETVIHMESVAVLPRYRGLRLQAKLLEAAEEALRVGAYTKFKYYMATVHPENHSSLNNFLRRGYKIVDTVKKYGGLDRHVLCKEAGI